MKETEDGERVGVLDVGSIPTTSTKPPETWADKPERVVPGLVGRNVHGVKTKPNDWYYTQRECDRTVGMGTVPPERNSLLIEYSICMWTCMKSWFIICNSTFMYHSF